MIMRRILFLEKHPMWIYGLPKGFEKLGHKVKICATDQHAARTIRSFKPDLIIAMGWTPSNSTPEKQRLIARLVQASNAPLIYWSTEDPGYTDVFSLPLIRRTRPAFVFSIHRPTVQRFRKLAISAAHLDFGSDPDTHRRSKQVKKYRGNAALVANGYSKLYREKPEHYRFKSVQRLMNPFLEKDLKVDIYGRDWNKMKKLFNRNVPAKQIHGYLPYKEAVKVYNSVDFVIGPQNAEDRLTQRTYEILSSGGLLITDDTPEVRRWFRPGKDLLVSSSERETRKLIAKYLRSPQKRERIRDNAVKVAAQHSYKKRAAYILRTLTKKGII
ncbi:glycosyltransferase [Paenibacillus amylolyticus]|uniref:CgeB family protein n=1 Tax=Paenibacillus TaxID=44249 RepID=UPI000FDB8202|nr:glycosyltransferase [Paenibacillus amylolyticus]